MVSSMHKDVEETISAEMAAYIGLILIDFYGCKNTNNISTSQGIYKLNGL